ncbi:MAG TPA: C25 family cysteine peptidase [Blastocatellia bacterium]|nr:C25 family cysteine peptidase [Blastocatellia bacterium]
MKSTVKGNSFQPARLLWIIPMIFLACVAQSGAGADTRPAHRHEAGGTAAAPRAQSSGSNSTSAPANQTRPVAPAASTTALLTPNGSGAGTTNGDYVSASSGGLNTFYRFFIEVPSGLSHLVVEIFDADVGRGGANEDTAGRDRDRNGYDTAVTYTLRDPSGTTRATLNGDDLTGTDNAWNTLFDSTTSITAGHWELRVDMSSAVTTGDDINAIGIRAHDGTSGSGGTELNIYADSIVPVGVNPPDSGTQSRSYTLYPYVTSGCSCSKNDFDFDSNTGSTGSMSLASRTGAFTQSYASSSMSADNTWRRDTLSGWTSDQRSVAYGIWEADLTITSYLVAGTPNGNYADFYMANFQAAANPPAANPVANSFRLYLPNDAGNAPVKPYVEQALTYGGSGPNPPNVGQTTRYTITVSVANPTAEAITFSSSNLVTANVPGSGATYAGTPQVSQGSIVSQPSVGGTGNITWNPGTVAAGATVILAYRVNVTPTSSGQRIAVTATPASGNGTRAQYVDETGNTTQSRATYLFGPLCELAVTQGLLTAVDLASFTATAYNSGVALRWQTGFEMDNLGFKVYRDEGNRRVPVTPQVVAGSALVAGSGVALGAGRAYQWWDSAPQGAARAYWLEEIDLRGHSKWHGPFATTFVAGPPPEAVHATALSEAGRAPSTEVAGAPLERTAKLAAASAQTLTAQASLAAQPALKLVVRHEGWYKVTQPEMVAAGFDVSGDPRFLQLFVNGAQVPIKVVSAGNAFDASSAIEFYGMGLDTAVTDARVYWLVMGQEPGLRIGLAGGTSPPSPARSFLYTVERKDRTLFFFSLKNGDQENFFGATVAATPIDQALTLQHLDFMTTAPATLEVALQGATLEAHNVRVQVNGSDVGTISYDNQAEGVASFQVAQGLLREGTNQVTLTAQGGDSDISFVDYVRLSYWHSFTADNDVLRLTTQGKQQVTISGFSNSAVRVFDITDAGAVQELQATVTRQKTGYAVNVTPVAGGQRILLALAEAQMHPTDARSRNQPSSWRIAAHGADLVIIAHSNFIAGVEPLKALRQRQGFAVTVVNVEDLYDEFSFGQKTPQAIRDFLAYAATTWKRPPRFALLVGNASRDPKNYLGFGDLDFVPSQRIDTTAMETVSDDWFVDFNGGAPTNMPIGRLPVRTAAQLSAVVAKIIGYEQDPRADQALLYADGNSGYDFAAASTGLRALLPTDVRVAQINRDQMDAATARAELLKAIARGQRVVNYLGHGSMTIWKDFVLTSDDAQHLENAGRLPLFVMMTCLNGYFIDPGSSSLAESLMNAERGGAVAVWASSGLTSPDQQPQMNQELFRSLFAGVGLPMTLGEATARAKAAVSDPDVRHTWILFGDPTMRLR